MHQARSRSRALIHLLLARGTARFDALLARGTARFDVAILLLLGLAMASCSSGKNLEGVYELEALEVEVQDPIKGYLELKKGGVLWAHWLVPESLIAVLSGYRETPAEKRHQTKGTAEHFIGTWEVQGNEVVLAVAGKGPTCRIAAERLECSSANAKKQTFRQLGAGKSVPDWVKGGTPVALLGGTEGAKSFDELNEGERLSVLLHVDKGAAMQGVRADLALKDKQAGGGLFVPKRVSLQIAYPLLGEWPVATITIHNDVSCAAVVSEPELSRAPVAFLRGRPSVQVQRIDLEFGCSDCSACSSKVESKTLTFVSTR